VVANVRQRPAVGKQEAQKLERERLNSGNYTSWSLENSIRFKSQTDIQVCKT
jgi:hypothetical protein